MTDFIGPVPASNFTVGRQGHVMKFGGASDPSFVVIHTMVGTIASASARFMNPSSEVSAHYGVGLDGSVVQWVRESDTAYHAGDWVMNLNSIGIEHEDNGDYNGQRTDALYAASAGLVRDICLRYGIPLSRRWIIKHNEVPQVATGCPDALDIDRIVAAAAGTWQPATPAAAGAAAGQAGPQVTAAAQPPAAPAAPASGVAAQRASVAATVSTAASAPEASPTPAGPSAPPPGDPLRDLAATIYGDPNRWQDIYRSIQGVVNEVPALLQLGKMLDAGSALPTDDGAPPAPTTAQASGPMAMPGAKLWGGSPGAIFALQIAYLAILAGLAGVYFINRGLLYLPQTLGPLPVAIPWFGALGAVLISIVGITEHRGDWDPTYRFWHWARPLLGASFGSISVLIFQAGILAVGTPPSGGGAELPKDLLYYLVSFVVGYREETFRELIKRLTDIIFSPGTTAGVLTVSSMAPLQGPAAGGTEVTIVGTGLSDVDTVKFGTASAKFQVDGDGQLTVVSPQGTAGTTVNAVVNAKSAATVAGSFTYV